MKYLLLSLLAFPLFLLAQESLLHLNTVVELDTVEVYNSSYFLGRVTETYIDEEANYQTSAFVLMSLKSKKEEPVLFYSTLLKDTSVADVLKRLRSGSWPGNPEPDDTLKRGEVIDLVEIKQLYHNLFEISSNNWQYYPGAAHGHGNTSVRYFDVSKNAYFDVDDVFKSGVYPFLQQKLKEHVRAEYENWDFEDAEVDSIAAQHYDLNSANYAFSYDGLLIQAQMYQSLFGWIEMGYNYFGIDIPWEELRPDLKPGNPLEKMLE